MTKYISLEELEEKFNLSFDKDDYKKEALIVSIFNGNYISTENNTAYVDDMFGLYNELLLCDYDTAISFYNKAIKKGYETSILNLASLYEDLEDYEMCLNTLEIGVGLNNIDCIKESAKINIDYGWISRSIELLKHLSNLGEV